MTLEWKPEYSLDIPQFDSQHLRIFFLINTLSESMERRSGAEALKKIMDDLMSYTKTHFQDEEKAMEESRFPKLDLHKQEHRKLEQDVENFYAELEAGKAGFSEELMVFLVRWLKDHIARVDRQYAAHMKSRERGMKPNFTSFNRKA